MMKRPVAVVVVSLLFIATGVVSVAYHLTDLWGWQALEPANVLILLVRALAIVCGVFMLRAQDWARWLALAWIGFHVVLSIFKPTHEKVVHGLLFVGIAYLLFRPEARAYFRHATTRDA